MPDGWRKQVEPMRDQKERLRYYEHLCRKAEKNTSAETMSCAKCAYHREDFWYRTCVFTRLSVRTERGCISKVATEERKSCERRDEINACLTISTARRQNNSPSTVCPRSSLRGISSKISRRRWSFLLPSADKEESGSVRPDPDADYEEEDDSDFDYPMNDEETDEDDSDYYDESGDDQPV